MLKEETNVKDGKSLDCTNASVQLNDHEQNISDKDVHIAPVKSNDPEHIQHPNMDDDFGENDFMRNDPLLPHNLEYHSDDIMDEPQHIDDQVKMNPLRFTEDENKNANFIMNYGDNENNFDDHKSEYSHNFDDYRNEIGPLNVENHSFDEPSGFLNNGFIGHSDFYD